MANNITIALTTNTNIAVRRIQGMTLWNNVKMEDRTKKQAQMAS